MSLNFAAATKILEWGKPVGWVAEQCKTITRNEMAIKYPTVKEKVIAGHILVYIGLNMRDVGISYTIHLRTIYLNKNTPQNSS